MLSRSKPVQLLQLLSKKDISVFLDHAELFAEKALPQIVKALDWMMRYYPEFNQTGFSKDKLAAVLGGAEKQSDDHIRHLLSILAQALEKFIIFRRTAEAPEHIQLILMDFYMETDKERFFNQKFDALRELLQKSASRSTTFHLFNYLACDRRYAYHLRKQREALDEELQETSYHLDTYYVIVRLRLFAEMLTREWLLKVTYEKPLLPVILDMALREPYASDPVVGVYRTVILMHMEPDQENHYAALLRFIEAGATFIPKNELNDLLVFAQNYCTGKINQGKEHYLEEIWNIYHKMMAYDVIYEGEYIRPGLLKNIVTVGVRLGLLDETENIIDTLSKRLNPDTASDIVAYNKAVLAFARKDFRLALKLLSRLQVTDIFYELGIRSLLLKVFYEMNDAVSFYNHLDTYYNYVRRNKVMSDAQKESHKQFLRFMRQLMHVRHEGNKQLGLKLRREIAEQGVLDSTWFHKKLDEMRLPSA